MQMLLSTIRLGVPGPLPQAEQVQELGARCPGPRPSPKMMAAGCPFTSGALASSSVKWGGKEERMVHAHLAELTTCPAWCEPSGATQWPSCHLPTWLPPSR